jgi:hypothetical protein
MKMWGICCVFATALFTALAVLPKSACAQDLLSGHIGVATPIVTFTGSNGTSNTTTIGNDFTIAFPFGIGVRPQSSPVVFDFEFVPEVHPSTRNVPPTDDDVGLIAAASTAESVNAPSTRAPSRKRW